MRGKEVLDQDDGHNDREGYGRGRDNVQSSLSLSRSFEVRCSGCSIWSSISRDAPDGMPRHNVHSTSFSQCWTSTSAEHGGLGRGHDGGGEIGASRTDRFPSRKRDEEEAGEWLEVEACSPDRTIWTLPLAKGSSLKFPSSSVPKVQIDHGRPRSEV